MTILSYFTLFSLPESFTLDTPQLEAAYFREQRTHHPDRFAGKTPAEKHAALQRSMDINQAYDTLKSPLKRAQYLLSLHGIVVGTEKDSVKPAHSLLTEVMELREERRTKPEVEKLAEQSITLTAGHYQTGDWNAMAQETLRLSYLMKILQDMKK